MSTAIAHYKFANDNMLKYTAQNAPALLLLEPNFLGADQIPHEEW
jgi:hypothetical protein